MGQNSENRFDEEAGNWDAKPGRVAMALSIADRIKDEIPLSQSMNAMEFGCGTGLITMALVDHLKSITAADTAKKCLKLWRTRLQKRV